MTDNAARGNAGRLIMQLDAVKACIAQLINAGVTCKSIRIRVGERPVLMVTKKPFNYDFSQGAFSTIKKNGRNYVKADYFQATVCWPADEKQG